MIKYVKDSVLNVQKNKNEYNLYNIPVFKLEPFTQKINFSSLLKKIEDMIPPTLLRNVEVIYVTYLDEFTKEERSFNAMYSDGAIYISPHQDNDADLLDDIIHEIAHSLEQRHQSHIYEDMMLEEEFLAKRRALYHLVDKPTLNRYFYENPIYNRKFDEHLYRDLSYDFLRDISVGLFYSPYAITSLREYWANGFENYLLGDKRILRDVSPVLYDKIDALMISSEEAKE